MILFRNQSRRLSRGILAASQNPRFPSFQAKLPGTVISGGSWIPKSLPRGQYHLRSGTDESLLSPGRSRTDIGKLADRIKSTECDTSFTRRHRHPFFARGGVKVDRANFVFLPVRPSCRTCSQTWTLVGRFQTGAAPTKPIADSIWPD
jgi:hypothetical protein